MVSGGEIQQVSLLSYKFGTHLGLSDLSTSTGTGWTQLVNCWDTSASLCNLHIKFHCLRCHLQATLWERWNGFPKKSGRSLLISGNTLLAASLVCTQCVARVCGFSIMNIVMRCNYLLIQFTVQTRTHSPLLNLLWVSCIERLTMHYSSSAVSNDLHFSIIIVRCL